MSSSYKVPEMYNKNTSWLEEVMTLSLALVYSLYQQIMFNDDAICPFLLFLSPRYSISEVSGLHALGRTDLFCWQSGRVLTFEHVVQIAPIVY
jgi:hypothetical protein